MIDPIFLIQSPFSCYLHPVNTKPVHTAHGTWLSPRIASTCDPWTRNPTHTHSPSFSCYTQNMKNLESSTSASRSHFSLPLPRPDPKLHVSTRNQLLDLILRFVSSTMVPFAMNSLRHHDLNWTSSFHFQPLHWNPCPLWRFPL